MVEKADVYLLRYNEDKRARNIKNRFLPNDFDNLFIKMEKIDTPLELSVLMCVYREPIEWIDESIQSILNQTFPYFEFLIINDNPDSESLCSFLQKKADMDSRIRIITNPENLGLTKSLNIGLKYCKGEFIARMDADDISMPTRFEKQVRLLKENQNIGIVGSYIKLIGTKKGYTRMPVSNDDIKAFEYFSSPFDHPATMMRSTVLSKNGISYDESIRYAQDQRLWYEMSKVCDFANIPEVLFYHRYNNQQISELHNREQLCTIKTVRTEMVFDFLNCYGIHNIDIRNLSVRQIMRISKHIRSVNPSDAERKKMGKISVTLLLSLNHYDFSSFITFLFSGLYLQPAWCLKDFLKVILKHFNGSLFSGAGISC